MEWRFGDAFFVTHMYADIRAPKRTNGGAKIKTKENKRIKPEHTLFILHSLTHPCTYTHTNTDTQLHVGRNTRAFRCTAHFTFYLVYALSQSLSRTHFFFLLESLSLAHLLTCSLSPSFPHSIFLSFFLPLSIRYANKMCMFAFAAIVTQPHTAVTLDLNRLTNEFTIILDTSFCCADTVMFVLFMLMPMVVIIVAVLQ